MVGAVSWRDFLHEGLFPGDFFSGSFLSWHDLLATNNVILRTDSYGIRLHDKMRNSTLVDEDVAHRILLFS